jgi:hypothetical protein
MARLGITIGTSIVFAAAGYTLGGPQGAYYGAQLGFTAGTILSAAVLPAGGFEGPRLGDLRVGDASPGVPIPIAYGTAQIAGNLIWTSGIEERRTEESAKGGGPTAVTYNYYASFAVGLCEGPLQSVRKIWFDTKLVYDVSSSNLGIVQKRIGDLDPRDILDEDELADKQEQIEAELDNVHSALSIYLGTETQRPDPLMEAVEGVGNVPGHRGLAYLVFEDLPLLPYVNRIPQVRAEVVTSVTLAYPKRTVTPASGFQRDKFLLDVDRQHVWARNGARMLQINALDNTIIQNRVINPIGGANGEITTGITQGVGMATAVDGTGVFVPVAGPNSLQARMIRLDPVSLAATHIFKRLVYTDVCTITIANIGAVVTAKTSQTYVYVGTYITNALYCFHKPLAPGCDGQPTLDEYILVNEYILAGPYQGMRPRMIAIDRDEAAWAICHGITAFSNKTFLVFMERNGHVEVFELTTDVKAAGFIAYDALTHSLIILGYANTTNYTRRIIQWDIASHSTIRFTDGITFGTYMEASFHHGIQARHIWTANDFRFFAFNVDTFTQDRAETVLGFGGFDGFWHYATLYDPKVHALWAMEENVVFAKYFLDREDPVPIPLSEIVEDISSRAGLTPATDLVTTALTEEVYGYILTRRAAARASLEPLLAAYLVDAVQSDWRITYAQRSNLEPVAALTVTNLGAHVPGETLSDAVTMDRLPDLVLPVRLDLTYPDPAREYQDNTQFARRHQTPQLARGSLSISTPVVMTATTAKHLVERSLWEAWVQRQLYQVRLPYRWSTLDPGDVITATDPESGRVHVIRITSIQHGANGVLDIRGAAYDRTIYELSDAAGNSEEFAEQILRPTTLTKLFLLDINMLRDADDDSGLYLAAAPDGIGVWPGAVVFQGADPEAWTDYATVTNAVTWGSATTKLADGSPYVFDREHTVDIRFLEGSPTSSTETAVLNGANALLLGDEILQFVTATLVSGDIYRLSIFLRGRRGTEWATGTHQLGDRAILLTLRTVQRGVMGVSDLDRSLFYRPVTFAQDLLRASMQAFTNTGNGLRPYAPDHVRGTRDGSENLTITWIRRTRIGGEWQDVRDVPLGEGLEAYEVDILDDEAVVRTIATTTQTAAYTAAEQTADGLTPGDPVALIVYQLNVTVGRGYGRSATV